MKKSFKMPVTVAYLMNAVLFSIFIIVFCSLIGNKTINTSNTKILMLIGINIILAVSLNIATGYLGQLPLGHAGFMAAGAYASAMLMKAMQSSEIINAISFHIGGTEITGLTLGFPIALVFGGLIAAVFGVIIGIPALRLRGDYLAIITLGFGEIIRVVLLNIDSVLGFKFTAGAAGLQKIPKTTTFLNTFLIVGITCFLIHTMMKSRHGRAILSIRENEIAAESCGLPTTYYKTLGFVVSAFFAGIAGGLYAGYIGMLTPGSFGFMKSIEILVMVVLGGMGSMVGSVVSATVLTALPQLLLDFAEYRMVVYSLVLVIVMIFKPSGMFGTYDFSLSRSIEYWVNRFRGTPTPLPRREKKEKTATKEGK